MVSSEDTSHTTKIPQTLPIQNTDALDRIPRMPHRRSLASERRHMILHSKQTDVLPALAETTPPKLAGRQGAQLRDEKKRLRNELEELRGAYQRLSHDYQTLQEQFHTEVAVIHNGHQQEIQQYQTHLHELMEERNTLQQEHAQVVGRYQELYHSFQDAVAEEAHKMLSEASRTLELPAETSGELSGLLHNVRKTLELEVRQEEDKHFVEVLYLKREVQRIADLLEQERQTVEAERQQLLVLQNTVREQAELRQQTLQTRLRTRSRLASTLTTVGILFLLVLLQVLFLALFHVPVAGLVILSLLLPIAICVGLAVALAGPLSTIKLIYKSAPHKKRIK